MPFADQHPLVGARPLSRQAAGSARSAREDFGRFLAIGSGRACSLGRGDRSAKYRCRDILTRGCCETRSRADNQGGAGARRLAPIQSRSTERAQFPGTGCGTTLLARVVQVPMRELYNGSKRTLSNCGSGVCRSLSTSPGRPRPKLASRWTSLSSWRR